MILEHSNKTTDKQYEISNKYLDQLKGVMSSGFNNKTNQFYFNIVTSHSMDRDSEKFKLYEDCVKSIKFLGDNLKKMDEGYVEFEFYTDIMIMDIMKEFNIFQKIK